MTPSEITDELKALAEARGLRAETLSKAGIWLDPDNQHPIRIPYPNLMGVWYERGGGGPVRLKYKTPLGGKAHLYNPGLVAIPSVDVLYICEGEFDTLSMVELGYDAVGLAGVGQFSPPWAELMQDATIVICFDGDTPGQEGAAKLAAIFPAEHVHILPLGEKDDLNALHQAGKLAGVIEAHAEEHGLR